LKVIFVVIEISCVNIGYFVQSNYGKAFFNMTQNFW